jgi:hypothetical protein
MIIRVIIWTLLLLGLALGIGRAGIKAFNNWMDKFFL